MDRSKEDAAVDVTPFVRRIMLAEHGQVLVTLYPDAPAVREQDFVTLARWADSLALVQRVFAATAHGRTVLLQLPAAG